jgi:putative glycosyltransferase (TIGR04372 family)
MEVSLRLCAFARHYPRHKVYVFAAPKTYDEACSFLLNPEIEYLFSAERVTDKFLAWMPWLGAGEAWITKREDLIYPEFTVPMFPDLPRNGDDVIILKEFIDRTVFSLPPEVQEESRRTLVELGLDESKWFIAMHMREDGYRSAPGHPRSIRYLDRYHGLIRHIVDAGGQVVRLGDVHMKDFPSMRGLIDLAPVPGSFLTQAYACSTARFLFASSSSPAIIATGFNTPSVFANALNTFSYMSAPKQHIIATKKLHMPDGSVFRDRETDNQLFAHEMNWYDKSDKLEELTTEELIQLFELMSERTEKVSGWTFRPVSPLPVLTEDGKIPPDEIARRNDWKRIYFSDVKGGLEP